MDPSRGEARMLTGEPGELEVAAAVMAARAEREASPEPWRPGGAGRRREPSKAVAILLALFLGGFGLHWLYLGRRARGLAYLAFSWTLVPFILALPEPWILLFTGERELRQHARAGAGGPAPVLAGLAVVAAAALALHAVGVAGLFRLQLRALQHLVARDLTALDAAEVRVARSERGYVAVRAMPAGGLASDERRLLSEDEARLAEGIGWPLPNGSYGRFAVAVQRGAGGEAMSACAESDLDGDGRVSALVLFRPAPPTAGAAPTAPDAPCAQAALAPGRSLAYAPGDPVGMPFRVSPDGVY